MVDGPHIHPHGQRRIDLSELPFLYPVFDQCFDLGDLFVAEAKKPRPEIRDLGLDVSQEMLEPRGQSLLQKENVLRNDLNGVLGAFLYKGELVIDLPFQPFEKRLGQFAFTDRKSVV